jgi:hypothetical protein
MLGLVTVIGMCVAGMGFCTTFLVSICLERRRHVVCYVLREKREEVHPAVPRPSEQEFAIGHAA